VRAAVHCHEQLRPGASSYSDARRVRVHLVGGAVSW
jgi:hypothetical protein